MPASHAGSTQPADRLTPKEQLQAAWNANRATQDEIANANKTAALIATAGSVPIALSQLGLVTLAPWQKAAIGLLLIVLFIDVLLVIMPRFKGYKRDKPGDRRRRLNEPINVQIAYADEEGTRLGRIRHRKYWFLGASVIDLVLIGSVVASTWLGPLWHFVRPHLDWLPWL